MAMRTVLLTLLWLAGGCAVAPVEQGPSTSSLVEPAAPAPAARPRTPRTLDERERAVEVRAHALASRGVMPATVPSGDPDADLAICAAWLARGARDRARPAFAALLRVHPRDPLVVLANARFLLADGDPIAAGALLDELAERGVDHPDLPLLRGAAQLRAGDPNGAVLLREELARGPHPVRAALELCDHLTAVELFGDAAAVCAAALLREPDHVDLRLLEARLLHDRWQLDAAAAALDELLARRPDLAPARVQRAEIERARGASAAGRAVLAELDPNDPWCADHARRLDELRRDLLSERSALTPRDLLAMVRGAPGIDARMQALEAMLAVPATRDAAIRVGFLQEAPVLRVLAIRAIPGDDPALADDLTAAAADPDARVRATAFVRTADLPELGPAVRLLSSALAAEEDPYAFRAAHDALVARLGPRVTLPPGGEHDPTVRNAVERAWRRHCPE